MRRGLPLLVGALAAAFAFAVVTVASDDEGRPPEPAPPRSQPAGVAVFARMGCGGCHRLAAAGSKGEIGPSLDAALAHHSTGSLRAKIINEGGVTAMPTDFGERMSDAELDALVEFLLMSRR